ncbi:MAG: mycofactocin system FadH/OYE family oxidoreductase 1 [Microthrixaceae bacterium]
MSADLTKLLEPLELGALSAPNRVVFGPHETNLGRGRSISERHVAYYQRRAAGGAGVIVVEEASVHESDWPYERAPLASDCAEGWASVVEACEPHGTVVLAALGHAGGQGTSHWSQRELWAPSRVPEVDTREVPKWMDQADIEAVISGFAEAARSAVDAGCHGVEVNAGQHSLARQFLSGLTNQRDDQWGANRSLFLQRVLDAVRTAIGPDRVLALRLSCDELAPWAGITPEQAPSLAAELVVGDPAADGDRSTALVDLLTVVRGSIFSVGSTRPDGHEPEGFNVEVARAVADAVGEATAGRTAVAVQGSIVDPAMAASVLGDSEISAVEMTRAQIADAGLVGKLTGEPERIRPCVLCNQTCRVRDNRNPIVTCVVDPFSGHETTEQVGSLATRSPVDLMVIGGGPAGLEAARVAAERGHKVRLAESAETVGGQLRLLARQPGRHRFALFADWLEAECRRAGVDLRTGHRVSVGEAAEVPVVIIATGGSAGERDYDTTRSAVVLTPSDVLERVRPDGSVEGLPPGDVLVWDPIGGPTGVAVAELLASSDAVVHLATQDYIVGNELARAGDLAPANARLARAGVVMHRRRLLRKVRKNSVVLGDRFSENLEDLAVDWVVDAGHRLPDDALSGALVAATGHRLRSAGDCVAPRSVAEAVLEGRRRALELG